MGVFSYTRALEQNELEAVSDFCGAGVLQRRATSVQEALAGSRDIGYPLSLGLWGRTVRARPCAQI